MRMLGKTALISGAASGIGLATAHRFAEEGGRVVVTDLDGDGAEATAAEIRREVGGETLARKLDVRLESDWAEAMEEVAGRWGGLDVLVASAGVSHARPVADMSLKEWREVHAVNLDGAFLGTKHAVRTMRETGRGGSIVVVGSASGVRASAGASAYCSSKAAVLHFVKVAARECARDGIRVNAVAPAGVVTPMWESMTFFQELVRERGEEGAWDVLAECTPLGRFALPGEVADAILYLSSDEASYVTGTELRVDGGYTA